MIKILNYFSTKKLNKQHFYNTCVAAISHFFILLFLYAASSKLLGFEKFKAEIGQSPLLTGYVEIIAVAVPVVEIAIGLMLMFKRLTFPGLLAAFALMVTFTAYIYNIVVYTHDMPCNCGGVLGYLSWAEHLLLNFGFVGLAGIGIWLEDQKHSNAHNESGGSRKT